MPEVLFPLNDELYRREIETQAVGNPDDEKFIEYCRRNYIKLVREDPGAEAFELYHRCNSRIKGRCRRFEKRPFYINYVSMNIRPGRGILKKISDVLENIPDFLKEGYDDPYIAKIRARYRKKNLEKELFHLRGARQAMKTKFVRYNLSAAKSVFNWMMRWAREEEKRSRKRRKILDFIQSKGSVSSREIQRKHTLKSAELQRHLKSLLLDNLIEWSQEKQAVTFIGGTSPERKNDDCLDNSAYSERLIRGDQNSK